MRAQAPGICRDIFQIKTHIYLLLKKMNSLGFANYLDSQTLQKYETDGILTFGLKYVPKRYTNLYNVWKNTLESSTFPAYFPNRSAR